MAFITKEELILASANADRLDQEVTTTSADYYIDRLGRPHFTNNGRTNLAKTSIETAILKAGYEPIDSFEKGATIVRIGQALRWVSNGSTFYRWGGPLPKVVPANSTPSSTGGYGVNAWIDISDIVLRADLIRPDGFSKIGQYKSIADLRNYSAGLHGDIVLLKSWREGVNLGGGAFFYDQTDVTSVDDDGLTIVTKTGARLKRIIHKNEYYATFFGAVPGDNITIPLQKFSAAMQKIGNGFKMFIDVGPCQIFDQIANPNPSSSVPYWIPVGPVVKTGPIGDIIRLENCFNFIIDFTGSNLITKAGLRFGSFNPLTGAKYTPPSGGFFNDAYAAKIGSVVHLIYCTNYQIINLQSDGNSKEAILGGYWGDLGIQIHHEATYEYECKHGIIDNAIANNYCLDGFIIDAYLRPDSGWLTHRNTTAYYCSRNALSLTGGASITLQNIDYCYTGAGAIATKPMSGIDFEAYWKDVEINNITIINPRLLGNVNMQIGSFWTINVTIIGGELTGTTGGIYQQLTGSSFVYNNVLINCPITSTKGTTSFNKCIFTDKPRSGQDPSSYSGMVFQNFDAKTIFTDCEFTVKHNKMYVNSGIFKDCNITIYGDNPTPGSSAMVFRPTFVNNMIISSQYTNNAAILEAGKHVYVNASISSGVNAFGVCKLVGNDIAWTSAGGNQNFVWTTDKTPGHYYYSQVRVSLVESSPGSGLYDIEIGNGLFDVTLDSFTAAFFVVVMVSQCSYSNVSTYSSTIITNSLTNALGGAATASIVRQNSKDYVRIKQGSVVLAGSTVRITKYAKGPVAYLPI